MTLLETLQGFYRKPSIKDTRVVDANFFNKAFLHNNANAGNTKKDCARYLRSCGVASIEIVLAFSILAKSSTVTMQQFSIRHANRKGLYIIE